MLDLDRLVKAAEARLAELGYDRQVIKCDALHQTYVFHGNGRRYFPNTVSFRAIKEEEFSKQDTAADTVIRELLSMYLPEQKGYVILGLYEPRIIKRNDETIDVRFFIAVHPISS